MTIEILTAFFGWMSVVNIILFLFAVLVTWIFKGIGQSMHASMFGLNKDELPMEWYRYLGNYKIAIIMLNIAPYLALRLFM